MWQFDQGWPPAGTRARADSQKVTPSSSNPLGSRLVVARMHYLQRRDCPCGWRFFSRYNQAWSCSHSVKAVAATSEWKAIGADVANSGPPGTATILVSVVEPKRYSVSSGTFLDR